MKTQIAAAILLTLALTAGCAMSHGDPKNPKKNPRPVKRYEVTATVNAPGEWDSVKGYLSFQVANKKCVPLDSFLGAQNIPIVTDSFEMKRVDDKTWKGYFYRDLLQDEDYFGMGVCHWDVSQASPSFTVHGEDFVPGSGLENVKPYVEYFKKSDFTNQAQKDGGLPSSADSPDAIQHSDDFFPITVTVKEVTK